MPIVETPQDYVYGSIEHKALKCLEIATSLMYPSNSELEIEILCSRLIFLPLNILELILEKLPSHGTQNKNPLKLNNRYDLLRKNND